VKLIGLVIFLAAIFPLSKWLRQNPGEVPKFWMLFGFLPFGITFFHSYVAVISWPMWPGYVSGTEFFAIDGLAAALYLSSSGRRGSPPFQLPMALYFFAVVISVSQAAEPMAAIFYPWQLLRMFLVYLAVVRGSSDPRVPLAILKGMSAGLVAEFVVAAWERFGMGIIQASGTLSHQNLLGIMTHFIILPTFALLLSGSVGRLLSVTVPLGIAVDLLTTSRATLGFSISGLALVFLSSSMRKWTKRKRAVLLIGIVGITAAIPLAISSFERRFSDQAELISSDYDERAAFEKSAKMMLSDKPLGQGANNYVIAANLGGYNRRAGVVPVPGSEGAHVHNVYLLVAAETGYLGLITFVFLLLSPLVAALLCGWKTRADRRGDLLIGLGLALLVVYVHCFYEWVFIRLESQYMFAMTIGLVGGLASELGYWQRRDPGGRRMKSDGTSAHVHRVGAKSEFVY
jgi:O-antigen ligase